MPHQRKQTFLARVGLLTALTVSAGLLAGCNPAPFNPGTPTAQNPGAKPVEFNTLQGRVSFAGAPLANAEISVLNALSDQPAQIIAAGGGNVIAAGGGNMVVQADSLKTDAQGNFSVKVAGLEPGAVARVVINGDGKTLSGLVTGNGTTTAKAYSTQAVTFQLAVSEVSTLLDAFANGLLKAAALGGSKGVDLLDGFLQTLQEDAGPELAKQAKENPGAIAEAISQIDKLTGKPSKDGNEAIGNLLKASGVLEKVTKAIERAAVAIAVNAKAAGAQSADIEKALNGDNTAPITLTITLTADGKLNVGDQVIDLTTVPTTPTGQTPSTDPSTRPSTEPSSEPMKEPEVVDLSKPVVSNASAFNPTIGIENNGSTSKVSVSQPAGSDDIAYIVTRMKDADVPTHVWSTPGFSGQVTLGGTPYPLSLVSGGTAVDITLPSRFNFIKLVSSNIVFKRLMRVKGADVATFMVYQQDGYFYLVTKYLLSDSVTISGGHSTWMHVPVTDVALKKGATVDTVLFSRKGNSVERLDTVK